MAEWFKALVLKTRDLATGPGVRIPLLPYFPFWTDGAEADISNSTVGSKRGE